MSEGVVLEVDGVGNKLLHLRVGVSVVVVEPGCANSVGPFGGGHAVEPPEAFLLRVLIYSQLLDGMSLVGSGDVRNGRW